MMMGSVRQKSKNFIFLFCNCRRTKFQKINKGMHKLTKLVFYRSTIVSHHRRPRIRKPSTYIQMYVVSGRRTKSCKSQTEQTFFLLSPHSTTNGQTKRLIVFFSGIFKKNTHAVVAQTYSTNRRDIGKTLLDGSFSPQFQTGLPV